MDSTSSIPNSILVVIDNFLIGGRETYIASSLESINSASTKKSSYALLASKIDTAQANSVFDEVSSVDEPIELSAWLEKGDRLVANNNPSLIWAHHYGLLPAFMLAVRHDLPLVITLHGAPFSHGKLAEADILGLLLCLQFGGTVTAVSEEIKDELKTVGISNSDVLLTPNSIVFDSNEIKQTQTSNKLNCLLMSRPQKLDHIRAAISLAAALNRKVDTKLTIHLGRELGDTNYVNKPLSQLLGRKWILTKPSVWSFLKKINIKPPIKNSQDAISQANVVFGMGRVLLEGIAANRLSVLIGYNEVMGVLNQQVYDEFKYSNFSGRAVKPKSLKLVVNNIVKTLAGGPIEKGLLSEKQCNEISIEALSEKLIKIFNKVKNLEEIQTIDASNAELQKAILQQLSPENMLMYKQLCSLNTEIGA